jgi:hypothetical protein
MKKFILLSVVSAVLAFAAGNAVAANPVLTTLSLSASGSATFNVTNYTKGQLYIATTATKSFNNATLYSLITNAVANASNGLATNLPANGYIVFNIFGYDGGPEEGDGYFYVTNKTGFYYPLSGFDANSSYYSFMELDSVTDQSLFGWLGFFDTEDTNFDDSVSYSYNYDTGNGSVTSTSTALLYIHDNPYNYDDVDTSFEYILNNNAIEIRGILKVTVQYKDFNQSTGSGTLTGTGNVIIGKYGPGEVISGTAKFSQ